MTAIPEETLDRLVDRWQTVQNALSEMPDQETFVRLSREFAELDPLVAIIRRLREARDELAGLRSIADDPQSDGDMVELAHAEIPDLESRVDALVHQLRLELLPKDAADEKSAIIELRAGTGGEEAALFAGDLFRMYQRYAALRGWKVQIISESETGKGGYREVIANFSGKGVFARLKYRIRRAPRAARSRDGGERPDSHFGGDGRGAARG